MPAAAIIQRELVLEAAHRRVVASGMAGTPQSALAAQARRFAAAMSAAGSPAAQPILLHDHDHPPPDQPYGLFVGRPVGITQGWPVDAGRSPVIVTVDGWLLDAGYTPDAPRTGHGVDIHTVAAVSRGIEGWVPRQSRADNQPPAAERIEAVAGALDQLLTACEVPSSAADRSTTGRAAALHYTPVVDGSGLVEARRRLAARAQFAAWLGWLTTLPVAAHADHGRPALATTLTFLAVAGGTTRYRRTTPDVDRHGNVFLYQPRHSRDEDDTAVGGGTQDAEDGRTAAPLRAIPATGLLAMFDEIDLRT